MKAYLDTEFNGFNGELISIALVTEDGKEFYEVLKCAHPVEWVRENVMPVLNRLPETLPALQHKLADFFAANPAIREIVADWPEDIQHFCKLLIVGPGMRIGLPFHSQLSLQINFLLSSEKSATPHNALADARAIRESARGLIPQN